MAFIAVSPHPLMNSRRRADLPDFFSARRSSLALVLCHCPETPLLLSFLHILFKSVKTTMGPRYETREIRSRAKSNQGTIDFVKRRAANSGSSHVSHRKRCPRVIRRRAP